MEGNQDRRGLNQLRSVLMNPELCVGPSGPIWSLSNLYWKIADEDLRCSIAGIGAFFR